VRSCLFTGIKPSRSQGLLAAQGAVSNEIRLGHVHSRRTAAAPAARPHGVSGAHHIGSAADLRPHTSSEAGQHGDPPAPGSSASSPRRRRRRTRGQLLPREGPLPSRPRRGPESSGAAYSGACTASTPERLAGRGLVLGRDQARMRRSGARPRQGRQPAAASSRARQAPERGKLPSAASSACAGRVNPRPPADRCLPGSRPRNIGYETRS
jgi:hypothetical protein